MERGRCLAGAAALGKAGDRSSDLVAQAVEAAGRAGIRRRVWAAFLEELAELGDHNLAQFGSLRRL